MSTPAPIQAKKDASHRLNPQCVVNCAAYSRDGKRREIAVEGAGAKSRHRIVADDRQEDDGPRLERRGLGADSEWRGRRWQKQERPRRRNQNRSHDAKRIYSTTP